MDQTNYSPMEKGEAYIIYAVLFIVDRVDFLVRAPQQPPFWAPSCLFDLVNSEIPAGWGFCDTRTNAEYRIVFDLFRISHIMKYSLLVSEYVHYQGVVERDPAEVRRFMELDLPS